MSRVYACLLTLSTLCVALPVTAAEPVTADQRLPPGVLLYLSAPNVVSAHESFQNTDFSDLVHDPALEDFRKQLVDKYNEWKQEAEEKLDMPVSDVLSLLSGEVSVAVVRPVGQTLGGALFMDIGNHQDTLKKLIAKAEESDEADKVEKETDTVNGQEITTYTIPQKEEGSEPVTVAYFVKDNMLVVSSAVSILESILDRWDGKHAQTFAINPVYKEIIKTCRSSERTIPAFQWFVDPVGLIATGLGMNPDTQLFASMVYAPTFGLSNLKGMGGAMEMATEEFNTVSRSMYYVDGPASGILKIFEFRPTISAPPEWVPAESGQFFALDWNLKAAYESIESMYDSFTGPGKFSTMMNGLAQQGGVDLHPKTDIIDVLSGKFQWYLKPSQDPQDFQGTLSIGVVDAEKGQNLVSKLVELNSNQEVEKSELDGHPLYVMPGEGGNSGAVTVKDQSIFVARNADQLKLTLSGPAKTTLKSSPGYQQIAKHIPEKVSLLAYQNAADQVAAGYEKARAGDFDSFTEGKLDFSVLPPFEVLRKYFTPSASYLVPHEHGTLGVSFSVKRK